MRKCIHAECVLQLALQWQSNSACGEGIFMAGSLSHDEHEHSLPLGNVFEGYVACWQRFSACI